LLYNARADEKDRAVTIVKSKNDYGTGRPMRKGKEKITTEIFDTEPDKFKRKKAATLTLTCHNLSF